MFINIFYPLQTDISQNSKAKMKGSLSNVCGYTPITCKRRYKVRNHSHLSSRVFAKYIT